MTLLEALIWFDFSVLYCLGLIEMIRLLHKEAHLSSWKEILYKTDFLDPAQRTGYRELERVIFK